MEQRFSSYTKYTKPTPPDIQRENRISRPVAADSTKSATQTHPAKQKNTTIQETRTGNNLSELESRLSRLETEHDTLINDIRQETNSNIDKINLWLAIWICIIGVFAVFIPLLIQYRLYTVNRERLNQEMAYFRDFVRTHNICNIAGSFLNISTLDIASDSEMKNPILRKLLREAADTFEEIIDSINTEYNGILTSDILTLLIQSLLQIATIVNKMKQNDRISRTNLRGILRVSDSIKVTIRDLEAEWTPYEQNQTTPDTIKISNLRRISNSISGLSAYI